MLKARTIVSIDAVAGDAAVFFADSIILKLLPLLIENKKMRVRQDIWLKLKFAKLMKIDLDQASWK